MRGKRMPYYAHIRQAENGQTIYQTVAEHLTGTAALCRKFAADFGAEAAGDLMGIAHDLGTVSYPHLDVYKRQTEA